MIEVDLPGARVAFSTRNGGVSEGPYESLNLGILTDDDPDRVRAQPRDPGGGDRPRPGGDRDGLAGARHRHPALGRAATAGRDGYAEPGAELTKVDGHVTDRAGLGLLVLVADCLPVALAAPGPRGDAALRLARAGRRDRRARGGAVRRAARRRRRARASGAAATRSATEVLEAFADVEGAADGRMLDLRAVAEARLRAAGVEQVEHVDLCTSCRADLFFSHRRDGGVTGRQAGVVWRTG